MVVYGKSVGICTEERGWLRDVSLEVEMEKCMDELDQCTAIVEAAILWCSDNGYSYAGCDFCEASQAQDRGL